MSRSLNFVSFAAGAIIGSVATWRILNKKYEQLFQEEIKSVKETFSKNFKDNEIVTEEKNEESLINEEKANYKNIVFEHYLSKEDQPYVISPDEFGEKKGYKLISLTYFSDEKLADDVGYLFNVDEIGEESLKQFGEYEEDSVHVRNDLLKADYEILLDPRKYSEVYPNRIK